MVKFAGSDETYITASELAEVLHLDPETINTWRLRYPDFPHLALPGGRSVRLRISEIEHWLQNQKKPIPRPGKNTISL